MANWKHLERLINSFIPRWILAISWRKNSQKNHWSKQGYGDPHGYDKYSQDRPQAPFLLNEIESRVSKDALIMDVGCNCGYYIKTLKKKGFKNVCGVDISKAAIEYGRAEFGLKNEEMHLGSFEKILPTLVDSGRRYDVIFSMGATIELVHPSFDIIKHIGILSKDLIILFIQEWGHIAPRMYEYEFQKQGFLMIKCLRPYDQSEVKGVDLSLLSSMLVFKKID